MGLTDLNDHEEIKNCKTYNEWYQQKNKTAAASLIQMKKKKNLMNRLIILVCAAMHPIETEIKNSALLLQNILEKKLAMQPHDKDMIVMLHEIGYEINGESKEVRSSLIVTGEDQKKTAMAKTVGLPLGIAAKLILQNKIKLTGLHIPVLPEIYEPVLAELEEHQIKFQ